MRIKLDKRIMERPQGTLWDVRIVNGKRMYAGDWLNLYSIWIDIIIYLL